MSYLNSLLATNERVVRVSHDHWIALLPTIIADGAIGLAIVGLSVLGVVFSPPWTWLGFLLLFIPLVHLLWRIWIWWSKQYAITNRRVIQISGMVNKRVSDTLLEKINDIVTEQSAMGRLLKFGDVEIIAGSDSGVDVFYRLADPIGFKKDLLDQKASGGEPEAAEEPEKPVQSVPDLIAELGELREKGLITDAEFEEKRRKLLDRI
jgi:uncharacterized membrane protein YdbT with pleckstrin-like domain